MADPITQGIFLAISTISTVSSAIDSKKAASAQQKGIAAQRAQEALSAAIQRREAIKAGRRAQALALQIGENQGAAFSSGAQGAVGSLGTQLNANLSFLDRQTQLADFAGSMFDKAARFAQRAATSKSIGSLAYSAYNYGTGLSDQKAAEEERTRLMQMFGNK